MNGAFPFDDPAWDSATDAYGKTDTRTRLRQLSRGWDTDIADDLFFSRLLHQETVYPVTFLALPHVIALAPRAPAEAQGALASFLGGVALSARMPSTSGGVSLADSEPFAATPLGQRARAAFEACRAEIARLNIAAFAADPFTYFASGLAAAEGQVALASWLASGENSGFLCPSCGSDNEWLLFGDDLAIYRGTYSRDDWHAGAPKTAHNIAQRAHEPPEVTALRARLGPPDPTTQALLLNYRATATCPSCGWQGVIPDPRLP